MRQHDARAELIVVCSGEGQHKERTVRHLLLDPMTPVAVAGIVTELGVFARVLK